MSSKKDDKYVSGEWCGTKISLTKDQYDAAMSHVEHYRHTAEENNYYEDQDEGDEDYLDPESWYLSDTLEEAFGRREKATRLCRNRASPIYAERRLKDIG